MNRDDIRRAVVEAAASELKSSPRGDTQKYWSGVGLPGSFPRPGQKGREWCGIFVLWALKQAGLALHIKWRLGVGFLYPAKLPTTRSPKPGDVAYFHQPFQHHALVESFAPGLLVTLDGNQPGLARRTRVSPVGVTYYSIEPLLDAAEKSDADTDPAPPPSRDGDELRMGARGPAVAEVQRTVGAVPDGIWGPRTDEAVRAWQRTHRLLADGVWDNRCRRVAGGNTCEA